MSVDAGDSQTYEECPGTRDAYAQVSFRPL